MTIFFVMLVLACLNIGLGYGLAVYLGHTAHMDQGELPIARNDQLPQDPQLAFGAMQVAYRNERELTEAESGAVVPEELTRQSEKLKPNHAPPARRKEISEADKQAAAAEVAAALNMSLQSTPPGPAQPEPAESSHAEFDRSVEHLQSSLAEYSGKLSQLDKQMRTHADDNDREKIKGTIEDIRQVNTEYLREHDQAVERMQAENEVPQDAAQGLRKSLEAQGQNVKRANEELAALDLAGNLKAELARAFSQVAQLNHSNSQTRDSIADTMCQLAEREGRLSEIDEDQSYDSLTGLLSKIGLQAAIQKSLQERERDHGPLSVAMIDVDHFQQFNQSYGTHVGDVALKTVAELLEEVGRERAINARYSGGTFVVVWPKQAARNTTAEVERIRQSIECTRFFIGEEQATFTVSCSLVQYQRGETGEQLFERAKATMTEARRYGRNRSFLNEGSHPAPVLPPNLTIKERTVTVN